MSEDTKTKEVSAIQKDEKPIKSFSINSILARVEKEKEKEYNVDEGEDPDNATTDNNTGGEDVPAVVSKLEFPMYPAVLPKGFPGLPHTGEGGLYPLGHLPAWYHWYASQQNLQQWQSSHRKCKLKCV